MRITKEIAKEVALKMDQFIKIMSLEEALKLNGETLEHFNWRTERDSDGEKAGKELEAIAKAINGGKHMDFKNTSVGKYWSCFRAIGSGSGFSPSYFCHVDSLSSISARLCVASGDAAMFFANQHIAIWDRYINGQ